MSYIQEYTCEFEEYYYKAFDSSKEMLPYLEKYYQKLPGFWAKYFREEYEKENLKGDTLGQRINFLKNRLAHLCMSHNIQRKAKRINTQIYCKDTKASSQWGCEDRPYKKRKQLKKGLIKRKNFSKQKYIPRAIIETIFLFRSSSKLLSAFSIATNILISINQKGLIRIWLSIF